jgi:periplasmic protein TonB
VTDAADPDFTPPTEAKNLSGQIVTGVTPVPLHQSFPEWPDSLRQQHFSVTVAIVIGKDGRVQSAHATSGPQNAFKSAEATARKWTFQPYLVLDEPAEVSTKITLNNN